MGTSVSYRAPETPRWRAFVTALEHGAPLERLRSELFNAGNEWENALASPAVGVFAERIALAHEALAEQIASAQRVDSALVEAVADARNASVHEGFSPALGLAERAFAAQVLRCTAGETSLAELTPEIAASNWSEARGAGIATLIRGYLAEIVRQYADHVVTREAGRLATAVEPRKLSQTRELAQDLREVAARVTDTIEIDVDDPATTRDRWPELIAATFESGRRLPRESP